MKILKEANMKLGYEHYVTKELDRGGKMHSFDKNL
jgi:hypothetical protein